MAGDYPLTEVPLSNRQHQRYGEASDVADQESNLGKLFHNATKIEALRTAWRSVRSNGLASTSSDTRISIELFDRDAERNLTKIQRRLRDRTFQFEPQTGILKKKASGGYRGIVMASLHNRIVERAWLDSLQAHSPYVRDVVTQPTSVGGVPGRSVPHGLKLIRDSFDAGKNYFVRSDISGFFDHVPRLDVIAKISKEVDDQRFIEILMDATTVVLGNEEKLGEDRNIFPTNEEGVAQGSPLSPLFGNILLHQFDLEFNHRGITCVRFIDDFVLLAETESKAQKAFESAGANLKNLGLSCHNPFAVKANPEKASYGHIDVGFVFLGYDIRPGLFQPSKQARSNLLKAIDGHISFGRTTIGEVLDASYSFEGRQRYAQTLVLVDKVARGWGDAFAYSNSMSTLQDLDVQISKRLDSFRDWFSQQTKGQDWKTKRRLGGVGLVSDVRPKSLEDVPFTLDSGQRFARSKNTVTVSTDGSIITAGRKKGRDQGPGGWAFVVHETDEERSGSVESSTNNRMELLAVIEAIRFVKSGSSMIIRTDSQYIVEAVKGATLIKTNGDLWQEYKSLTANRKLRIVWVKGHNGDLHNERADSLAVKASRCVKGGHSSCP